MSIPSNVLLDMQAVSQRSASWRFDLLDQGRQILRENLPIDRDAPPTISVDVSRAIKRTLTGLRFNPGLLETIDIIKNRLAVTMVLGDGTTWPQGIYMFTDVSAVIISASPNRIYVPTLNCVDQLQIVDQALDYTVAYGPGKVLTDAVTELLAELPIEFAVTPSGVTISPTQEAVAWPAGTSRLRIINELAVMLGYHDLYFDNNGIARFGPMPNPDTADEQSIIRYPLGGRTYLGMTTTSTNLLDLPNRFIVVNTGASQTAVFGTYDVPASAPHSYENRGYRRTHVEQVQGVETNEDAAAAARALARDWRFAFETIEFCGPPDPRHDHYNILDYEGDRVFETGWGMACVDGSMMRHTARRVYDAESGEVLPDE